VFDRFTEESRLAMGSAHDEAARMSHDYIGTEHMLLGLVATEGSAAREVLGEKGLTLEKARREAEHVSPAHRGAVRPRQMPFSARGKEALEHAVEEASRAGHDYVGTGHLLLGLLGVEGSEAAAILGEFLIRADDVRAEALAATSRIEGPAAKARPARPKAAPEAEERLFAVLSEIRNELRSIREILELDRGR